jgi:hypothetical protein
MLGDVHAYVRVQRQLLLQEQEAERVQVAQALSSLSAQVRH